MIPKIDIEALRGRRVLMAFDLDDTLAPEVLFLRSGARHVAMWLQSLYPVLNAERIIDAVDLAVATGLNHYDATERVLAQYGLREKTDMAVVVKEFRWHLPDTGMYHMAPSIESLLLRLDEAGITLAIVTDGRSVTQRHKIDALRLERFVAADHIFISEETGHDKMHPDSFLKLMEMHPDYDEFHYVGDNPPKDFLHPSRLGWITHLADPFPLGVHCGLRR